MRLPRVLMLVAASAIAPALLAAGQAAQQRPPNILFVIADDLNTRVGPYVEPSMGPHTPNLDRLAAEGVTFTRTYSQFPVCGPSRASLMSGLDPETNGPTMAGFLREHGYYTARVSKIAGLAADAPAVLQGDSLLPLLRAPGSGDPDTEAYTINARQGASLRTARWRYNR